MWCIVPAAGSGRRFGSALPKQYQPLLGRPVLRWTLERLAAHAAVDGLVVALAADDPHWPGWQEVLGKPVRTVVGGAERADSVLAGLRWLATCPGAGDWVMVHDAARPCVRADDLDRLVAAATTDAVGAILAGRVRDTLKRDGGGGRIAATIPRETAWRAFTPQIVRRTLLQQGLEENESGTRGFTDEASVLEASGHFPLLVEGSDDNLKITSSSDLGLAESLLKAQLARE
jgi:2-C-methyl-D-erythritol 4-phosphate cytidylyltransferase